MAVLLVALHHAIRQFYSCFSNDPPSNVWAGRSKNGIPRFRRESNKIYKKTRLTKAEMKKNGKVGILWILVVNTTCRNFRWTGRNSMGSGSIVN